MYYIDMDGTNGHRQSIFHRPELRLSLRNTRDTETPDVKFLRSLIFILIQNLDKFLKIQIIIRLCN